MKKKIVFLTDANEKVGFGHLNRTNLLAKLFYENRYDSFIFGVKKKYIKKNYFKKISENSPIKAKSLNLNLIEQVSKTKNFFLIIDTYRVNLEIQKKLLKANAKWLQFDNFQDNKKLYADIVVNANPLIKKKDYKRRSYSKKKQIFLTGKKYILIRDEFKKRYKINSKFILICSGGGRKDKNYIDTILRAILKIYEFEKIVIILDKNDPRRKKILKINTGTNKVKIVTKTNNISRFFAQSKIVYLSGGTILIESLFYDLKRFVCSIAANQVQNCLSWEKLKFVNYLGDLSEKKLNNKNILKKIKGIKYDSNNQVLNRRFINGKKLIYNNIIKLF